MLKFIRKPVLLSVFILLLLLLCLSGRNGKPSRSELHERLNSDVDPAKPDGSVDAEDPNEEDPDLVSADEQGADAPDTTQPQETSTQPQESTDSPAVSNEPEAEDGIPSDDELIELLRTMEIGLTSRNTFTFRSASELTCEELYLSFLLLTPYDELNRCWDEGAGSFYFTQDFIEKTLSAYYRDYSFDIRRHESYNEEARAIVTPLASGFGGERNMHIDEKTLEDDMLTVCVSFYDIGETELTPETCNRRKRYTLERHDSGWYFISAIELPMEECAESETAELLLTMLSRAQFAELSQQEQISYMQQPSYRTAVEAFRQYLTENAAQFAAYAEAPDAFMRFYWLESGMSCVLYADTLDETLLLYRPSTGVSVPA